jgi:hypothetical protein
MFATQQINKTTMSRSDKPKPKIIAARIEAQLFTRVHVYRVRSGKSLQVIFTEAFTRYLEINEPKLSPRGN